MKTFIVLAICLVVVQGWTDEQKVKLKKFTSECLAETKVDEQLVNKLKTGDDKAEDEALKKYALCMFVKTDLMNKDAKFNMDVAMAKVQNPADRGEVQKLINACLANKGSTPHQTAWNYIKCYHQKDPHHPLFI